MSISEQLVAENIALRQAVAQLTERVDDLHMGNVEEWSRAGQFLAQLYYHMGQRIPGEWRDIGKQCGWTPGQIAIAEVLANETRQALYKKARRFDDPIANHELAQAVDDEQGDKDAVGG